MQQVARGHEARGVRKAPIGKVDSAPAIGFHSLVRGTWARRTAALLVLLLLATPFVAGAPLTDEGGRAPAPAHDAGWTAQPTTARSAILALTPAAATIAPAATSTRALVGLRPPSCRSIAECATGRSVAVKPAPLVLRV